MSLAARFVVSRLIAMTLAAGLVSGCEQPESESTGDLLRRGMSSEVQTLDPHHSILNEAQSLLRDLYEGLVAIDGAGVLKPAAAESWSISDDGLRYTFRLRQEARWSDGSPVSADAFVFAFRRIVDPIAASPNAEKLMIVEGASEILAGRAPPETLGVAALDDHTLEITLAHRAPYFLSILADTALVPLHAESVLRHGPEFTRPGNLISNGAYELHARAGYDYTELVRNPHYWDRLRVAFPRVQYVPYEEAFAQFAAYRAGDIHLTDSVPSSGLEIAIEQFPDELSVRPAKDTFFYGFNMRAGQLLDAPALREALSMVVQRQVITQQVTMAGEQPAHALVPPVFPGYDGPALPWIGKSGEELQAAAHELLQAASIERDGLRPLRVLHNTNDTVRRVTVATTSMWREHLGIRSELINQEFKVFVQTLKDRRAWDVARLSWRGDYDDPYSFLEIFTSHSPNNFVGFDDPIYDELLRRSLSEQSPSARLELLREAEQRLLDAHVIAPVYFYVDQVLAKPWVELGARAHLKPLPTAELSLLR